MNYYSVYFCSKNTGPRTIEIEARSDTDARAQINARFPGVTNMSTIQLQQSSSQKAADEARRKAEYNATQARFKQEDADRAAHQRQMKQDARDRQARQEANNRADQARRDQERRDEQARQDRERQERQHRETLNAIKSNKSSGVLPFVAGAALGYVAGRNTQPDAVVVAPYDEEIGSQSWWEQRALASQSFTTREAELLFLEESVDTV